MNLFRIAALAALLLGISPTAAQNICCSGGGSASVTFPLNGANGTSAAPSYGFTNGTDSGMYANANGSVAIVGAKGAVGGAVTISGGIPTSGTNTGGSVNITAGSGVPGITNSGNVAITVPSTAGVGSGILTLLGGATGITTDSVKINSNGGRITIEPLPNDLGGSNRGSDTQLLAGRPASASTAGGGNVLVKGGPGTTTSNGPAGGATVAGGDATEGNGGSVTITGTSAATATATAHNGGNVNITAGAASGTGTVGEVQINGNGAIMAVPLQWNTTNPNGVSFFTATRAVLVKAIICRPDVLQGAVATLSVLKAPSATAISAGTLLHSGSFDANAGAATNQTLTLSATLADINLAAGDSIGATTTGTWTVSKGNCTVHLQPK